MKRFFGILALGLLAASAAAPAATPLPVETLDGKASSVPDGLDAGPRLLVIAFSRGAQKLTKDWDAHLAPLCGGGPLACYDVAVIEKMPSFVTEMAVGRMRDETPYARQSHTLLVLKGTADWQQLAATPPAPGDDAYLVLLGADGAVRWRGRGPWSAGSQAALQQALKP